MNNKTPSVVLIVDDSVANLMTAKRVLERQGYIVLTSESGKQALQIVKDKVVDLILLDIMMPEINGFDTCIQLKKDSRFADIPVIFLTALGDTESMAQGFDVGGIDYIVKPFQRTELVMKVKNHLELSVFHRMQNEFMSKISAENTDLKSENNQLQDLLNILPQHVRTPVTHLDDIFKQLSARLNLQDDEESRSALDDAQLSLNQLKMAVEVIDKLHAR